ncbi:MAG: hypothetical protein WC889_09950 [Myxococcota bacterium]|jgi:hypothetical protein
MNSFKSLIAATLLTTAAMAGGCSTDVPVSATLHLSGASSMLAEAGQFGPGTASTFELAVSDPTGKVVTSISGIPIGKDQITFTTPAGQGLTVSLWVIDRSYTRPRVYYFGKTTASFSPVSPNTVKLDLDQAIVPSPRKAELAAGAKLPGITGSTQVKAVADYNWEVVDSTGTVSPELGSVFPARGAATTYTAPDVAPAGELYVKVSYNADDPSKKGDFVEVLGWVKVTVTPDTSKPEITNLNDNRFIVGIGTLVKLGGHYFGSDTGAVIFKREPLTGLKADGPTVNGIIKSWTDTGVELYVPPYAANGAITLRTSSGKEVSSYVDMAIVLPTLTTLDPEGGQTGSHVTIIGENMGDTQVVGAAVLFDDVTAEVVSVGGVKQWSDKAITVIVPTAGLTRDTVDVSMTVPRTGTVKPIQFKLWPKIASLTPPSGYLGDTIEIRGEFFGTKIVGDNRTVGFTTASGFASVTPLSWSDTLISVKVPKDAITGNILVKTPNGTGGSHFQRLYSAPQITGISPSIVSSNTADFDLTVSGTGFWAKGDGLLPTLSFGGIIISNFKSVGAGSVVVTIPSSLVSLPSVKQVFITNPDDAKSNEVQFTVVKGAVLQLVPAVSRPNVYRNESFTISVDITNSGGAGAADAVVNPVTIALTDINGTPVGSYFNIGAPSPTPPLTVTGGQTRTVTWQVGAKSNAPIGKVNVAMSVIAKDAVSNVDVSKNTSTSFYMVKSTPAITTTSPAAMSSNSPDFTLVVNGTGFMSGAQVTFGTASPVTTFVSSLELHAAILSGMLATPGTVDVRVTNSDGEVSAPVSFQILTSATLQATAASSADPVFPGDSFTISAEVTNPGQAGAKLSGVSISLKDSGGTAVDQYFTVTPPTVPVDEFKNGAKKTLVWQVVSHSDTPIANVTATMKLDGNDVVSQVAITASPTAPFETRTLTVTVAPPSADVYIGGTKQFSATVKDNKDNVHGTVTWTVTGGTSAEVGTIDEAGLYHAPATWGGKSAATVVAQSVYRTGFTGTAAVAILKSFSVTLAPSEVWLHGSQIANFAATVKDSDQNPYEAEWSFAPQTGTLDVTATPPYWSATYTAPETVAQDTDITITVKSKDDPSVLKTAVVHLLKDVTIAFGASDTGVRVNPDGVHRFNPTVSNAHDSSLTWTATAGTMTKVSATQADYTAPTVILPAVTVTATSVEQPTVNASVTLSVAVGTTTDRYLVQIIDEATGTWTVSSISGGGDMVVAAGALTTVTGKAWNIEGEITLANKTAAQLTGCATSWASSPPAIQKVFPTWGTMAGPAGQNDTALDYAGTIASNASPTIILKWKSDGVTASYDIELETVHSLPAVETTARILGAAKTATLTAGGVNLKPGSAQATQANGYTVEVSGTALPDTDVTSWTSPSIVFAQNNIAGPGRLKIFAAGYYVINSDLYVSPGRELVMDPGVDTLLNYDGAGLVLARNNMAGGVNVFYSGLRTGGSKHTVYGFTDSGTPVDVMPDPLSNGLAPFRFYTDTPDGLSAVLMATDFTILRKSTLGLDVASEIGTSAFTGAPISGLAAAGVSVYWLGSSSADANQFSINYCTISNNCSDRTEYSVTSADAFGNGLALYGTTLMSSMPSTGLYSTPLLDPPPVPQPLNQWFSDVLATSPGYLSFWLDGAGVVYFRHDNGTDGPGIYGKTNTGIPVKVVSIGLSELGSVSAFMAGTMMYYMYTDAASGLAVLGEKDLSSAAAPVVRAWVQNAAAVPFGISATDLYVYFGCDNTRICRIAR